MNTGPGVYSSLGKRLFVLHVWVKKHVKRLKGNTFSQELYFGENNLECTDINLSINNMAFRYSNALKCT